MTEEIWKEIPGFSLYRASNMGRIKSLKYGKERIMKQNIFGAGYLNVELTDDNMKKRKGLKVHSLVLLAFGHDISGLEVDHLNGIKTDNRLENLEAVTHKENMRRAYATGLKSNAGEKHPSAKVTESRVREIRMLLACGVTLKLTSNFLGVSKHIVQDISRGKTWTHI